MEELSLQTLLIQNPQCSVVFVFASSPALALLLCSDGNMAGGVCWVPGSCPELSAHRASPGTAPAAPCMVGRWHRVVWSEGQGAVGVGCAGGACMGQLSALNPAWWGTCKVFASKTSACCWSGDGLSFERTSEITGVDQSTGGVCRGHTGARSSQVWCGSLPGVCPCGGGCALTRSSVPVSQRHVRLAGGSAG